MGEEGEERIRKAKNYAYRLLAYRARSLWELRERLKKKKFSKKIIEKVTGDLERLNYINDRQFSKSFVEVRFSTNPCGRKLIEQELRKKGIDEEIINETCEEAFGDNKEYELARNLASRKLSRYRDSDEKRKMKRLYNQLASRGFQHDTVQEILSEFFTRTE